jgi:hypothetical protein
MLDYQKADSPEIANTIESTLKPVAAITELRGGS